MLFTNTMNLGTDSLLLSIKSTRGEISLPGRDWQANEHLQAEVRAVESAASEVVLHKLIGNLQHHRTKHQG